MNHTRAAEDFLSPFLAEISQLRKPQRTAAAPIGIARAPGVIDLMGGIGEDGGTLLLTASAGVSYGVAAWTTSEKNITLHFHPPGGVEGRRRLVVPQDAASLAERPAAALIELCGKQDAEWAAPSLLALREALAAGAIRTPEAGLGILVWTDFPAEADLGRCHVQAAATVDALCKLLDAPIEPLRQARICAEAIGHITGLTYLRKAMTALCAPSNGAILQLCFAQRTICQALDLPEGVVVKALLTRLDRPTTLKRLIETRTCSEMGLRVILQIQEEDGSPTASDRRFLSAVTQSEYVAKYRDRVPQKIGSHAFVAKFGQMRGLEDGQVNAKDVFKIRSRAEHHIYEHQRVQEFVAAITRARRTDPSVALGAAGQLMYASHWSHSQRCGIGGVESDRLVCLIRGLGAAAGLYGAKVTAGGEGGELAVLMRDDERAQAALCEAMREAEAASSRPVHVYGGSLPGAQYFSAPTGGPVASAAGAV